MKLLSIVLLIIILLPIKLISQNLDKRLSFGIGGTYHTPLFSLSTFKEAFGNELYLSPNARSSAGFERPELRAAINYRLKNQRWELSAVTFIGEGELYSFATRTGNDIVRIYERQIMLSQAIQINRFNKPEARYAFYYGAGINLLNIGKTFDAQLKSSLSDPNPLRVTVPMQAASLSLQAGRSIGKNGVSRNLMLELKTEYIPNWGKYVYSQKISWLRFGASVYYRIPAHKKSNKR